MGLPASSMRLLALSATLPNAADIGEFIGGEVFRFGPEYRPVPLQVTGTLNRRKERGGGGELLPYFLALPVLTSSHMHVYLRVLGKA